MTTKTAILFVTILVGAAMGNCRADEGIDAATQARIAQFDKGPSSVDVSHYPPLIQRDYKIFRAKCSLCHTPARPINSDFVLPDEWSRYVKRMMFKPGSMISAADAKKIYTFLVYDASVRKQAELQAKLASLPPADRTAETGKIAALHQEYDGK